MAPVEAETAPVPVTVRPASEADRPFMFGLASRLAGVARLPWRDPAEAAHFQDAYMRGALVDHPVAGAVTLIAVDGQGTPLGFIHVEPARDSLTEADCGYVSLLAVTPQAEGRGVARRLLAAAEGWAREMGYRFLSLEVFAGNDRGRKFYARAGYREESLRLLKPVSEATTER